MQMLRANFTIKTWPQVFKVVVLFFTLEKYTRMYIFTYLVRNLDKKVSILLTASLKSWSVPLMHF